MPYSAGAAASGGPGGGGADHHKQVVEPGESVTTNGRTITNDADSGGNATVTVIHPGTPGARVIVTSKSQFKGKVEGLKVDDEVTLGYGVRVKIVGTGGEIDVSGGSRVEVKNEGQQGGPNMLSTLPNGNVIETTPGSTSIINTH